MTGNSELCSFRYRSICDYSLKDISEGQLYFSPPHKLNDPSDLQIDFAKIQREIIEEHDDIKSIIKKDVVKELQAKVNRSGIVCFSDNPLNEEMWEKYADNSSGICCTYRIPQSFIEKPENKLLGWSSVDYGGEGAFKDELFKLLTNPSSADFFEKVITKYLTIKSEQWSYEKEFRIVSSQAGYLKIPKAYLVQIIFGAKTESSNITLIRNLVQSSSYGAVVFAQVKNNSIIELPN